MSLDVEDTAQLVVQVAVAHHPGAQVTEELVVTLDGEPQSVTEVAGPYRNRLHLLECEQGRLEIGYRAHITGAADELVPDELDRATYLRPSRYAESDRLTAVAAAELAGVTDPADLLAGVSSWVGERLSYVPGSSGPTDGAVDTLLSRAGVCRDYAHLVVALLRASDVPARLVAVYAPACPPWTFMLWPRRWSTGAGKWWTQPCSRRAPPWSASPPAATRPTRRSCPPTVPTCGCRSRRWEQSSTATSRPTTSRRWSACPEPCGAQETDVHQSTISPAAVTSTR